MAKPFPLQAVKDIMQERADDAAARLAKLIALEMDAKSKLAMLEDYRLEYAERFSREAQNGMSPVQWQNFQGFLNKLDEAISSQKQYLSEQAKNTAEGQKHFLAQRQKVKAFDTLATRHFAKEETKENRLAQKAQDEFSARKTFDKIMAQEENSH